MKDQKVISLTKVKSERGEQFFTQERFEQMKTMTEEEVAKVIAVFKEENKELLNRVNSGPFGPLFKM